MDPSVASIAATTFHCFPRLPFDLRRIIWGLAVSPRTITCAGGPKVPLPGDTSAYLEDPWEGAHWTMYGYGTTPPPPLLQACSESRSVAISDRLYSAALWPAWVRIPQSPRYTWVNYEVDTIQLPTYLLIFLAEEDKMQIRRAVLDGGDNWKGADFFTHIYIEYDMIYMQSLQELRILTGDNVGEWRNAFHKLRSSLEAQYGGKLGWAVPKITIIHKTTGEKADESNIDDKYHALYPPGRWPRTFLGPMN